MESLPEAPSSGLKTSSDAKKRLFEKDCLLFSSLFSALSSFFSLLLLGANPFLGHAAMPMGALASALIPLPSALTLRRQGSHPVALRPPPRAIWTRQKKSILGKHTLEALECFFAAGGMAKKRVGP